MTARQKTIAAFGALLGIVSCSCATPAPRPRAHPPAPPPASRPTPPPASAPTPAPLPVPVPATIPLPRLGPLLLRLAGKLVASGAATAKPLWAQAQLHGPAKSDHATLEGELKAALGRARLSLAAERSGAAAIARLDVYAQHGVIERKHVRVLALVLTLSQPGDGELLWLASAQTEQSLGPADSHAPSIHPTGVELLEMAETVGRALREKLTRNRQLDPSQPIVIALGPVRDDIQRGIDGELVGYCMLERLMGLPKLRAVLYGGAPSDELLRVQRRLGVPYVLKGKLTRSGGGGTDTRLAFHLHALLQPLIATNAPVVDASSTLLPPLAPDL